MIKTHPISGTQQAQKWLDQFSMGDRPLAQELLESFLLVSRDDFNDHLRALTLEHADRVKGVVALYAERELGHRFGVPHRLFKESPGKHRRALGAAGPPAVKSTKGYDPSVGSEGVVARLITDLCREFPKKFISHPGPEQIRRKRVRAFWVMTDLVGSGHRARRYLEAAWLVRSVRSWWSGKFLRFAVVAYASTGKGEQYVRSHPCRPDVIHVMPCPTIDTTLSKAGVSKMKLLCETYDPTIGDPGISPWSQGSASLGYLSTGALLIFAHGAPNNVPLMFHKASKRKDPQWIPLFPSRVTAGIDSESFGVSLTSEKIQLRLERFGHASLARSNAVVQSDIPTGEVFLILCALSRPPRLNDSVLSRRTGLPTYRVARLCHLMVTYGWIDSQRRLTDAGAGQLRHARKQMSAFIESLPDIGELEQKPYYPQSLRRPV
ncbi:phosphoribosyltransferase-like protein [Pseudomonas thivervalensis]|uniref:phosphoribosyltransferase-like protein n=1 Tax=Pseudomonas thivervalensis TaxID=86265 RepID=UPI00087A833D|nr:MarR family transcriptional regulator [Pseudomonas thivervalensis]SDG15912.1 hypothetical protein SAMN04490204_3239 [Pseudomonas thivervalensis]